MKMWWSDLRQDWLYKETHFHWFSYTRLSLRVCSNSITCIKILLVCFQHCVAVHTNVHVIQCVVSKIVYSICICGHLKHLGGTVSDFYVHCWILVSINLLNFIWYLSLDTRLPETASFLPFMEQYNYCLCSF